VIGSDPTFAHSYHPGHIHLHQCGVGDVFFLEEAFDDVGLLLVAAEV
jgi:hypothetical protein